MNKIYLDHAATTPVRPEVLAAMLPYFSEEYGNPSSLHTPGQRAKEAVDKSRRRIAEGLGVSASEVLFTSSGTESDNLAILGVAQAYVPQGKHLITSAIEHEAVMEAVKFLEKNHGFQVTVLPVNADGLVSVADLRAALTPETTLVTIMAANNEVGTIQPLVALSQTLKDYKKNLGRIDEKPQPPFFHTDACQAAGVLDLNVKMLGVDLLTLNGSKLYGPKGVGVLVVKKGIRLMPQLHGGGQEQGLRPGTHNVPAIVGMAEAFDLALAERTTENERLTTLRNHLWEALNARVPDLRLNGTLDPRLPNNLNLVVKRCPGEILLLRLDQEGIYASAGSACTAGSAEPSHVLRALGVSKEDAYNAVRFTLGKSTTLDQIDHVVNVFERVVLEIRGDQG